MAEQADDLKILKDISVEWFKIHADQRLKAFNFFIIISGFLLTGYFAALAQENRIASMFVGAMTILVSIVFKLLDMRTAQLLKVSEAAVGDVLKRINIDSEYKNLIDKSNNKGCTPSYRQSFNALYLIFAVAGLMGFLYAAFGQI